MNTGFRRWIWVVPLVLAAGCSKSGGPAGTTVAAARVITPPAAAAATVNPPVAATATSSRDRELVEARPEVHEVPVRRDVRIPEGTTLRVRLDETVDTQMSRAGDRFRATLATPVVVGGETVLPIGTRFHGHVTASAASGRLQGRAVLALTLDGFRAQGRDYSLRTTSVERVGPAHKKRNALLIGGGTGLGAMLGAIAGGGKGAALGAVAGGGAGTVGAAATGKEQLILRAETPLTFTTRSPIEL